MVLVRPSWTLALLMWFCPAMGAGFLMGQAEEGPEALVRAMLVREKQLVAGRQGLFCQIREKVKKLDEEGGLQEESTTVRITRDAPRRNYAGEDAHRLSRGEVKVSDEEPFSILDIMPNFNLVLLPDEKVDGRLCHKISFFPKPGQSYRGREEKVANHLEGILWIDCQDYSLVKNTGRLTAPVEVAWFLAMVREIEFSFTSAVLPNGELGPKEIHYRFKVEVFPFWVFHETHTRTYVYATEETQLPLTDPAENMVEDGRKEKLSLLRMRRP